MIIRLNKERIRKAPGCPEETALEINVFPEIDSTNAEGKRRIYGGLDHSLLLAAECQSMGRGRLGRSFYSPEGAGLYMTLCIPAGTLSEQSVRVTAKTAVAVLRAIESLTDADLRIKWVNDLYAYGRKCCGILVETVFQDAGHAWFVIGIGINVTAQAFPEELKGIAGSLHADGLDRNLLAAAVTREILIEMEDPADTRYLALYRARSMVIGQEIAYGDPEKIASGDPSVHTGTAEGIDDTGALLVRTTAGELVRLSTGDISIRVRGPVCRGEEQ